MLMQTNPAINGAYDGYFTSGLRVKKKEHPERSATGTVLSIPHFIHYIIKLLAVEIQDYDQLVRPQA